MAHDSTLVILHGTMIDGSGNPPVPNEAIVIEGNRIRSIGTLPEDVQIEDRDRPLTPLGKSEDSFIPRGRQTGPAIERSLSVRNRFGISLAVDPDELALPNV